jgi:hypothetical protein
VRRNPITNSAIISSNRRRVAKRAMSQSYSLDSLNEKLQDLHADATRGDYQAQLRLESINQLLNPCLEFCESDVRRIINKGYPPQVERGLKLYRIMSRLTMLCEPVGDTVGVACRVRLINFGNLTFSELIDLKGHTFALISRMSDKGISSEQFNGLELLKSEEKDLYERAKRYFGGRKRPTLKSLAINLLGEEGVEFSDRSASNHLAAVRDFRNKHKDKLGFSWYFFGGVDSYNKNPKSAREFYAESVASMRKVVKEFIIPDYSKLIGKAIFGMHEQILRSQKWASEFALTLPSIIEQIETARNLAARNLAAGAIFAAMHMPRIELPNIFFRDSFM